MAASTGTVPSASAERSCSTAWARSSKRSRWRPRSTEPAGPLACSTLAAAATSCGVISRTAAAARCASSAAERPSSTAWACSRNTGQPGSVPSALAPPPESMRASTCSSCARDSASASKAGAEPRTAAPACSGMFWESDASAAACSRTSACWLPMRPATSSTSAASTVATSATAIRAGCRRAASYFVVIACIRILCVNGASGLRRRRPAGTAGFRAGCAG